MGVLQFIKNIQLCWFLFVYFCFGWIFFFYPFPWPVLSLLITRQRSWKFLIHLSISQSSKKFPQFLLFLCILTSKAFIWSSLHTHVSPSLSVMRLPPPTESFLNRWPVAGCCCALLVGLQEAAYLCLCVRACFSARVCVRAHEHARVHIHKCVRLRKGLTLQMLILVRKCVCVFVCLCQSVLL